MLSLIHISAAGAARDRLFDRRRRCRGIMGLFTWLFESQTEYLGSRHGDHDELCRAVLLQLHLKGAAGFNPDPYSGSAGLGADQIGFSQADHE